MKISDYDTLEAKNNDELFEEIGGAILGDSKGILKRTAAELVAHGRKWLDDSKALLCSLICSNENVRQALREGKLIRELVLIIIDVLEHHTLAISPVPPAAAGMLFVRYSYHKLCPH